MQGKPPIIALTMGDPCGIGPEVIAKAIANNKDVNNNYVLLLLGDFNVWEYTLAALGLTIDRLKLINTLVLEETVSRIVYFLDISKDERFIPGELSAVSGAAAMRYLEKAVDLALNGEADAVVTAPISKEHINEAGYPYAGHTDYFYRRIGGQEPTMCFYTPEFTIALLCDHVPLREVCHYVTEDRISNTITRTIEFLKAISVKSPKIGVMGYNPHCGEGGLLGDEEISAIIPAIENSLNEGFDVIGPLTPETAFQFAFNGKLDGIIAMYHDQGIAPLKISAGVDCVNVSLGLPFVRTSVSHGTAADIAGKSIADETSMLMALRLAARMVQRTK